MAKRYSAKFKFQVVTLRGLGFVQRSLERRNTESHRDSKD